jgi:hypothetical protein
MSCRKVFSLDNLSQAFSKNKALKELEDARREGLFRADTAYGLETQAALFPVIHVYDKLIARFEAKRDELEGLEQRKHDLKMALFKHLRQLKCAGAKTDSAHAPEAERLRADIRSVLSSIATADAGLSALHETVDAAYRCIVHAPLPAVSDQFSKIVRSSTDDVFDAEDIERFAPQQAAGLSRTAARGTTGAPAAADAGAGAEAVAAAKPPRRLAPCTRGGCLGSYTHDDGRCMVCRAEHCVRCAKPLAEPQGAQAGGKHVCDPADVATAKFLAASTKPCPRCRALITRESGCPQMMCMMCHVIFNWNTLQEEKGVIHNPHFYGLSAELRQRIADERAARGIAAGREARFLAGVAPHNACDADAAHDPLCVEFGGPVFLRLLEDKCKPEPAERRRELMEAHRTAHHFAEVSIPRLEAKLRGVHNGADDDTPQFTERATRELRVAYLRGGRLLPYVDTVSVKEHPLRFKSSHFMVMRRPQNVSAEHYKKQLMAMDTRRNKVLHKLETMRTYVAATEDAMRLLLASTPEERPKLVDNILAMRTQTLDIINATDKTRRQAGAKRGRDGAAREQRAGAAAAAGGDLFGSESDEDHAPLREVMDDSD